MKTSKLTNNIPKDISIKRYSGSEWSVKNIELDYENYKCTFFKQIKLDNGIKEIIRDIKETELDVFKQLISNYGFIIYKKAENKEIETTKSTCWKCKKN